MRLHDESMGGIVCYIYRSIPFENGLNRPYISQIRTGEEKLFVRSLKSKVYTGTYIIELSVLVHETINTQPDIK